ncbi:GNAT family N-acetyltransferase [Sphingobium cloacae]|uniref:GCN5-like N-acetyltransferase n=1 Tax=Sphingobium cloacae TaxID=120107 RepID=A0A1E1F1V3_9SPHN|nr:GNAT family N-acetyltransferase [Sphingobium cloacae]BAV64441.1 GCN5-like N-acetyltransferase [Sphingobium cloacae]
MTKLTTRRAAPGDLESLAFLFDAYRAFYRRPSDIDQARAFIGSRLENHDSVILVAEDPAGEISGFCQLYRSLCSVEGGPIYIVYDLFVRPAARRSGAGQALLRAAEQYAFDHDAIRMDLRTEKSNFPAQKLYEAHGWIQDQRFFGYSKQPARP